MGPSLNSLSMQWEARVASPSRHILVMSEPYSDSPTSRDAMKLLNNVSASRQILLGKISQMNVMSLKYSEHRMGNYVNNV